MLGPQPKKNVTGDIAVAVTGEVQLSFSRLGAMASEQKVEHRFSLSTGLATYYADEYNRTVIAVKSTAKPRSQSLARQSRGTVLYVNCGAPTLTEGIDDKLWVELEATAVGTYPRRAGDAKVLTQSFTSPTGYSTYYADEIARAATRAEALCRTWVKDLVDHTSATPAVISCAGPEVVKGSQGLEARLRGQSRAGHALAAISSTRWTGIKKMRPIVSP